MQISAAFLGWAMKQRFFFRIFFLAFLATGPGAVLSAGVLRGAAAAGAGADTAEVVRATLPNGMRVIVVPNHLAPVVATELNYLAGSNDAPDGFPGTAHALEHMMFRGSEGLDKDQVYELGARLGGHYNAVTTETATRYLYTVPSSDLSVVLRAEALRMKGLSLTEEDWQQERGAIEQEVSRDLSSPMYNYVVRLRSILFDGTPYAHDALGTRDSFDKTGTAILRDFYDKWYAPNNAVLVIAGDVKPAEAIAQANTWFGDIPARTVPVHRPVTPGPVQPKMLTLPTNFPVGVVSLAWRMPGLRSPDFAAADILADVLGSQRAALYALVPAGKALMAEFAYQAQPDAGTAYAIAAYPEGADPGPVLADMERIVADAVRNGVPPELVEAAKRRELANLAFRDDSIAGLASTWSMAVTDADLQSPDDLAKAYQAVTTDDVNRVARQLLTPDKAVTAFLVPQESGAPPSGGGYGAAESFNRPPDHPVALPDWANAALANLTLPDQAEPAVVSVFPNGLRLIVRPEHAGHTVSVYGRIRQVPAVQQPPGKEGVASVLGRLFEFGTETKSRLQLREAVDELTATEHAGSSFQLRVLAPKFEAGMKLLAEHQLHPALPEQAFEVVQRQVAQSLAGTLKSPDYKFERAMTAALVPEGDPTLREATPATVGALTIDDVRSYRLAAFRPDLTTIVIVGDVSAADAKRVVTDTFGEWKADGPKPAIDLPAVPLNKASEARVTDLSSVQDTATLGQVLGVQVGHNDRYALMLGNTILGGGFSSRLYQDLRVKSGTVYGVSSSLEWGRTRTHYYVEFGADPGKVAAARDLVLRDLKDLQVNPVTDTELTRAKAQMLRELRMQGASVGSIASLYLYRDSLGLPLDSQQTSAKRYLAVTAKDIQRAFATWLRPDDLATVVKGGGE
jgi:zinc protease